MENLAYVSSYVSAYDELDVLCVCIMGGWAGRGEQSYELEMSIYSGAGSEAVLEWEEKMQDLMADEADELDYLNLVYFTGRSIDDALEESVSGDVHLLIMICELLPWLRGLDRLQAKHGHRSCPAQSFLVSL